MSTRKAFLLRIEPSVLDAMQRWANDDLRSLNGQIEFVMRKALSQAGRAPARSASATSDRADAPAGDALADDANA